ncbi:rhamnan synthesis F family protein [Swingsia samuiensis]|uniref:Glycosyl transferase n=1 Tax=Swingsia samuiensis TaxID=1293412 RepID=A0A4Y6UJY9_9PROT|nr:rhamnan synthesis F family protein [Swingsia samuiensis]QDH16958.1 hypothetical protein E3D00_04780 [Swingsia samuiensis]
MANRVCLFAYHSNDLLLAPHTRHLLQQISSCGYELHIALSGILPHENDKLNSLHKSFLSASTPIHAQLYPRANQGLDFGAWRDLLQLNIASQAEEILFANDSVFGPLTPLKPIVDRMSALNPHVWGMVRSEAITQHLQSWFLVMKREALFHPKIQAVFQQPFHSMSKDEIVLHGELGLGLAMQAANFDLTASWASNRGLARLLSLNPMHTDWTTVLHSGKAPFIKTELLRDNPSGIASTRFWKKEIPDTAFFNPLWIEEYLLKNPPRAVKKKAGFRARCVQALASEDRLASLFHLFFKH